MKNITNYILRLKAYFLYYFCLIFYFYHLRYERKKGKLITHTRQSEKHGVISWFQWLVVIVLYIEAFRSWRWLVNSLLYVLPKSKEGSLGQALILYYARLLLTTYSCLKMMRSLTLRRKGKVIFWLVNELLDIRRRILHLTGKDITFSKSTLFWLTVRVVIRVDAVHLIYNSFHAYLKDMAVLRLPDPIETAVFSLLYEVFFMAYEVFSLTVVGFYRNLNEKLLNDISNRHDNCKVKAKSLGNIIKLLQRLRITRQCFLEHFAWITTMTYWNIFTDITYMYPFLMCFFKLLIIEPRIWLTQMFAASLDMMLLAVWNDEVHVKSELSYDLLLTIAESTKRLCECPECKKCNQKVDTFINEKMLYNLDATVFGGFVVNREYALAFFCDVFVNSCACAQYHMTDPSFTLWCK